VTCNRLALRNAEDMLRVQPPGTGPYLVGGHSYGGAVAVEIALILESWGHDVGLVIVSGQGVPEMCACMQ
jgi:thioesterase domain-containing protein